MPSLDDSPLSLNLVELPDGGSTTLEEPESEYLLYVFTGSGVASDSEGEFKLEQNVAMFVPSGLTSTITADGSGLSFFQARVEPQAPIHAPLGKRARTVRGETATKTDATSNREFQLLFGPHNGSCRASFFLGYVPPGRSPWHYHIYDEIVCMLDGNARHHLRDRVIALNQLEAIRIRPQEEHVLENTLDTKLTLLGVFTPAISPSAAFLPS